MKLARRTVFPSHAQVHIGDYQTGDIPEWDDDQWTRGVIAGTHYVIVATRQDLDGHVVVDVRAEESGRQVGETVFDGLLSLPSGVLSVHAATDDPHPTVIMPSAGDWRIIVSIDPREAPRHVTIQIPQFEHPDMPRDSWMWS